MQRRHFWMAVAFVVANGAIAASQSPSADQMLIEREKQKWEEWASGAQFDRVASLADDFVQIGYLPDGNVRRVRRAGVAEYLKNFPPTPPHFDLSEFQVIHPARDTAIITYRATAPLDLYATSVWANRAGRRVTVFYQATRIPAEPSR